MCVYVYMIIYMCMCVYTYVNEWFYNILGAISYSRISRISRMCQSMIGPFIAENNESKGHFCHYIFIFQKCNFTNTKTFPHFTRVQKIWMFQPHMCLFEQMTNISIYSNKIKLIKLCMSIKIQIKLSKIHVCVHEASSRSILKATSRPTPTQLTPIQSSSTSSSIEYFLVSFFIITLIYYCHTHLGDLIHDFTKAHTSHFQPSLFFGNKSS